MSHPPTHPVCLPKEELTWSSTPGGQHPLDAQRLYIAEPSPITPPLHPHHFSRFKSPAGVSRRTPGGFCLWGNATQKSKPVWGFRGGGKTWPGSGVPLPQGEEAVLGSSSPRYTRTHTHTPVSPEWEWSGGDGSLTSWEESCLSACLSVFQRETGGGTGRKVEALAARRKLASSPVWATTLGYAHVCPSG